MFYLLKINIPDAWQKADEWLFKIINNNIANPVMDVIMPFMRNALVWAPLYIFLIVFALLNFKKTGGMWILMLLSTVALTDMTGTYIFKHNFMRPRPCLDPELGGQVRLLVSGCSRGFSFISNHAANHMGIAAFFYCTTRFWLKKWAYTGFAWAALIAIAQVYVGVHYPTDIIAGTLVGIFFGTITGKFFNKLYGFTIFDNQPTIPI